MEDLKSPKHHFFWCSSGSGKEHHSHYEVVSRSQKKLKPTMGFGFRVCLLMLKGLKYFFRDKCSIGVCLGIA